MNCEAAGVATAPMVLEIRRRFWSVYWYCSIYDDDMIFKSRYKAADQGKAYETGTEQQ